MLFSWGGTMWIWKYLNIFRLDNFKSPNYIICTHFYIKTCNYEGFFDMGEGGGSVTAFLQMNAEGQLVLNYGISKVLNLFVEFLRNWVCSFKKICITKKGVTVFNGQYLTCMFIWTNPIADNLFAHNLLSITLMVYTQCKFRDG